ncbi:MAG: 50S ribosomal protein L21 [bacterium]|nr:50S ribosomal protein L21 [bacterium]
MYAVIETGSRQHRVQVGEVVNIDALPGDVGAEVVFDRVLLLGGGDSNAIGAPVIDGAKVRGSIVKQGRDKKIVIFTYKRRQNSNRRRAGHRQSFTAVKIESIDA